MPAARGMGVVAIPRRQSLLNLVPLFLLPTKNQGGRSRYFCTAVGWEGMYTRHAAFCFCRYSSLLSASAAMRALMSPLLPSYMHTCANESGIIKVLLEQAHGRKGRVTLPPNSD